MLGAEGCDVVPQENIVDEWEVSLQIKQQPGSRQASLVVCS